MKASRYLRAILTIFLGGLIYLLIYPPTKGSGLHCGWNGNIYIQCAGEEEMDLLMVKYDNDYR